MPDDAVGGGEDKQLGPISVFAGNTVKEAEAIVATWLKTYSTVEDLKVPEEGILKR